MRLKLLECTLLILKKNAPFAVDYHPIWDAIFFFFFFGTYTCALKDHLATIRNCFSRSLNYKWSQCALNLPYTCTWDWSRVCVVLSGTWKDWGRSLSLIWIYLNNWVKYYPCFLNAWIYGCPRSWHRESASLVLPEESLTQAFSGWMTKPASVTNAWVNCPYISDCLWQTSAAVWWQTSAQACACC